MTDQNHVNIVYVIDPGIRHKLASIKVEGNKYFDTPTIRERMAVETSSLILPYGRFSRRLLTDNVTSIKYLYQANGFLDIKVSGDLTDNYESKKNEMQIVIKIDEGPQTLVNDLKVEGANSTTLEELLPRLSNLKGQPFSEASVVNDRDAITYYYYDRGFPNVEFESAATPAAGAPSAWM